MKKEDVRDTVVIARLRFEKELLQYNEASPDELVILNEVLNAGYKVVWDSYYKEYTIAKEVKK